MDERELQIRRKLKEDFIHYAGKVLFIATKDSNIVPLKLNNNQIYIHKLLEEQKKKTGKVRAIILKGRQIGASTYTEARYYHQTTHRRATNTFILTNAQEATKNLFTMVKRFYDNTPDLVKPREGANNASELYFNLLDSRYKIATAGMRSIGRGTTIHLFHGSEVAFYLNEDEVMAGALQAVPDAPNTEVILESTSNGPKGMFYKMWQSAVNGENDYIPIFIPWYWTQEYTRTPPPDFALTNYELELKDQFKLSDGQLYWRRLTIASLLHGEASFKREYPNTAEEAFEAPNENAMWMDEWFHKIKPTKLPPLKRTVIAIDPAGSKKKHSDYTGIIVASLGEDDRVYVRDNRTAKYTPGEWATTAIRLYEQYNADLILAERNYGGDMVEYTIRSIDKSVAYKDVRAREAGYLRAEPVAHCYKRSEVFHVIGLDSLEKDMTIWDAYGKAHCPDSVAALVYAVTELKNLSGKPLQEVFI